MLFEEKLPTVLSAKNAVMNHDETLIVDGIVSGPTSPARRRIT